MRSITWVTILVSLFMFQSMWNVAAAFCVHEDHNTQSVQPFHFGHHQNLLCDKEKQFSQKHQHSDKKDSNSNLSTTSSHLDQKQLNQADIDSNAGKFTDHQDHLPSMANVILFKDTSLIQPSNLFVETVPEFNWINAYRSPDLFELSPPPEHTPLMVG